ncbi:MAG: hypothetical protein ACRC46_01810 [Thermoguttaceae bacterium]
MGKFQFRITLVLLITVLVSPVMAQRGQRVMAILDSLATTPGEPPKIIATFSLASIEKFRATINTITVANADGDTKVRTPILDRVLDFYEMVTRYNVDPSQPTGAVIVADGVRFVPIFFSPVKFEGRIESLMPAGSTTRVANGRYRINPQSLPPLLTIQFGELYVQQRGGWAFVAPEKYLDLLPEDPTPLLVGLDEEHLIAARIHVNNLPKIATTTALTVGEVTNVALAKTDSEKAMVRLQSDFLKRIVGQSEEIEIVFTYEEAGNDLVFRFTEKTPAKTQRGAMLERREQATTTLGGFFTPEEAVGALCVKAELTAFQKQQLSTVVRSTLGNLLDENGVDTSNENGNKITPQTPVVDEPRMLVNETVRQLIILYYEGVLASIDTGRVDMAATMSRSTSGLVAAYRITDAASIRESMDKLFASLETRFPEQSKTLVHRDFREVAGVKLTSLTPKIDSWFPRLLLGDDLRFLIGVSDDLFCIAIGPHPQIEESLVAAIESTTQEPRPLGEIFFVYSGYELGQMIATSGDPKRLWRVRRFAAAADPRATAVGSFTRNENTASTTFWINGKLLPSLNNIRSQARTARGW